MNMRFFSALAAVAMSTAIAGTAMAHESSGDSNTAATMQTTQGAPQNMTQSAQALGGSHYQAQPTRGFTGANAQRANDGQYVRGVNSVKVGPGPDYAWWKDR